MTDNSKNWTENTRIARAALETDPVYGSVTPPLYMSTNYTFDENGNKRTYDYSRSGNPTRDALGRALADLEGGYGAIVTSTGMSALDLAFQTLEAGSRVVAPFDCYGGTHRLLTARAKQGFLRVTFADLTNAAGIEAAFAEKPAFVLVETPSNPLLRITDIAAVAARAQAAGAVVAVDNTFLSPVLQKPVALGADLVVHSTTKYLNGHGDIVGGAVIAKTQESYDRLKWLANCFGITGAPFDSFLTLRGLRTLPLRVRHQTESAGRIAAFLAAHPAVEKTYYPGLPGHPGHDIAKRQQAGFGAMLSLELKGGIPGARAFMKRLCREGGLFSLAESLGGFESLAAHPATMTHLAMGAEGRKAAGIGDGLVRLSVGLESPEDLKAELADALEYACR